MKHFREKALFVILAITLLSLLLSIGVGATRVQASEGLEYAFMEESSSYAVVDIGTCTDTDIVIPDTYEGYAVTRIESQAFYNNTDITSLVIGNNVTEIGALAFHYCTALESVSFGNGSITIENEAFYFCTALESLNLGGVTEIGEYAFYNCTALDILVIPNSVTKIGNNAFKYCHNLIRLTLGTAVKEIGESAFENCYKLLEVYNLSSINVLSASQYTTETPMEDGYAGYYSIAIHNSLDSESILIFEENKYVFCYYNDKYYLVGQTGNEAALELPNSINGNTYEIIRYAFYCRTQLESIKISTGVTKIGGGAFYFCGIKTLNIPSSVTSIGTMAFDECHLLTDVYISDSVTEIGYSAFQRCYALESIRLPEGITELNESMFAGCKSLEYITLPKTLIKLSRAVFGECIMLKSVVIPSGVTEIGEAVFAYCEKLTRVIIPKNVTVIGDNAFYDCPLVRIYCGLEAQPDSFSKIWNPANRPVTWSYTMKLEDAFTFKGYSTNGKLICAGYSIDYGMIADYELSTGLKAQYGAVFASYELLNGKAPLDNNANEISLDSGKVIKASLASLGYSSYDIILSGVDNDHYDHPFVFSLYTYDSEGVKYIQTERTDTVVGISYNEILEGNDTDEGIGSMEL